MDPNTVQLIIFAEQMAALLAKTIVDLKNVIAGSSTKDTATILADADSEWNKIITNAQPKG